MKTLPIIFLVDDIAANRETLCELLETEDYRLVEAANGPTALQLAAETAPDLILLDVMMPGMDGYEVCRRLRADPNLAEVPVIMITALDDQDSRLAGLEAGADDFISKPFNRAELRARVRTITRLNRYRRLVEVQDRLRESEARFHKLAEHSDEVFWFRTVSPMRLTYVSPAVTKTWGVPVARLYEDPQLWTKAIHPDDQPRVQAAYEAMLSGALVQFHEEYRVNKPDGSARWVLDSGTPIRNAAGTIVSLGGVARDITERKNAEEHLLRAQRVENIGMLAAGIAHDFNNALAPIIMAGPLLLLHVSDPGARRILGTVEKSAERSVALVRQLLSFARGSSGQRQLLQIRHVLKEVVELAESTFPKSIRVEAHLPGQLWPVQADPTQVHQIFLNLCVNARDAMPQGGDLTVTASNVALDAAAAAEIPEAKAGKFLVVEVRDTGTGIPPDVLARIWEPFFTTKEDGKGTGLGLSTVRGIIANHHGFATVKTRPGRGTAFTVYLPAADNAKEAGQQDGSQRAVPRGNGELILVVDDEEPIRTSAAQILEHYGYQTATACDGADAIAVFAPRVGEVRLVLTDLMMPILGGAALAATLRRLNPALPIVAMSGGDSRADASHREFARAFLAKPFQGDTLLSVVRRSLDEVRPPVSTPPSP
jgi:PAS domain S-box-containing protein